MLRLTRKGQSTAEYAIVIGLVIAAVLAMQVYVKRGIQAKIRGVVDYQPDAMFTGRLYEPYYASSTMESTRKVTQATETKGKGEVTRTISDEGEVRKTHGTQQTEALIIP